MLLLHSPTQQSQPGPNTVISPALRIKLHLHPMIRTFKDRQRVVIPYISYLAQVIGYESNAMFANYQTNIQEHFVQKLNTLINAMVIKRKPVNITTKQAQASARRVKRAIFDNVAVPLLTAQERLFATNVLQHVDLPDIGTSLHYDLKADPMKVVLL
jgi:hypothetical protein